MNPEQWHIAAMVLFALMKYRSATPSSVAACMCMLLAGTFLMVEQVVRSNDYGHWMALARQATDDGVAERYFIKASGIRRDAIEPYEGLMERYKADGRFDDREERQYSQAIEDNLGSLQGDGRRWAELSYQTGLLYWFYYEADVSARAPGVQDDAVQYARIRSAAAWMRNAAAVKGWNGAETAGIYADIADFSLQVVPRIQQGLDAGLYKGYFSRLGQLVDVAEKSSNEIIRLNVAHLVQGALSVYPRKFRADGVGRQSLEELAQRVERMAVGTDTTSAVTDVMRQTVLEGAGSAMDDIAHAFVDARKVE